MGYQQRHAGGLMGGRRQGFSLLELVLVVLLVTLLASVAYVRYMALAAEAERAAFKGVWGWLRAGINLEVSRALARDQRPSLRRWQDGNPMTLLAKAMSPPSNYRGELSGVAVKKVPPGHWYYDLDQRRLVYHVRYTQNLKGISGPGEPRLYFRLQVTLDRNGTSPNGLTLLPVDEQFPETPLGFGPDP